MGLLGFFYKQRQIMAAIAVAFFFAMFGVPWRDAVVLSIGIAIVIGISEICETLDEMKEKIDEMGHQMTETTKALEEIRDKDSLA